MAVTTPLGRVERDEQGMRLAFERQYDEGVQEVWAALTSSARTTQWIGSWTGDPATGSVLFLLGEQEPGAEPAPVRVLECEPPTHLVLDLPSPDGTWRVAVDLSAEGPGTRLRFVQRLVQPYDASSIGPGWHYYLDRLGAEVARDRADADWADYYPALAEAYGRPS